MSKWFVLPQEENEVKKTEMVPDIHWGSFVEGMLMARDMIRHKSMHFLPYITMEHFIDAIEEGDEEAREYVASYLKSRDETSEPWPPEKKS